MKMKLGKMNKNMVLKFSNKIIKRDTFEVYMGLF